ncbi:MAG: Hsp20 family protein [Nitrososphaeria archaeon]|nr:Hsp20 family protein [Nitrososphaeria archaeon]
MSEKSKIILTPRVYVDRDGERYHLEIELPGVKKEDVSLEISERTFCIEGIRDDVEYYSCYTFGNPVNSEKVEANFSEGLLNVDVPLAHSLKRKKVEIK